MNGSEAYDLYEGELAANSKKLGKIKKTKCPVHKKSVRLVCDYDLDGVYAHITKCCCHEHAKRVSKALKDVIDFDEITLENCDGLSGTVSMFKRNGVGV